MLPDRWTRQAVVVALASVLGACGKSGTCIAPCGGPAGPTPVHPSVSSTGLSVGATARNPGYAYGVVVHLRETAGAAATITAVDLVFAAGSTTVATSHNEQPIAGSTNICPGGGAVDTRELATIDGDASHPYATLVQATVTYTDGTSFQSTATRTGDVPPLVSSPAPAPPTAYELVGSIRDADTRAPIDGARVEALNGANAGRTSTTDSTGAYTLANLVAGTFRMRASASGYDPGEQNVTIPDAPRADMSLRRTAAPTPAACAYAVAPTGYCELPPYPGAELPMTITRTTGSCGWRASADVDWIGVTSGSGSGDSPAVITVSVGPLAGYVYREGRVTVSWNGGQAQLVVHQLPRTPAYCEVFVTVDGQRGEFNVPSTGGQYTAHVDPQPGVPTSLCGSWTAVPDPPMTIVGSNTGPVPGTVTFDVPVNTQHGQRSMTLAIRFTANGLTWGYAIAITQAAAP